MTSTTPTTQPRPHVTHTVFNQSAPRVDINEYELNTVLVEAVNRHDAAWATSELTDVGTLVGSAQFQHDAKQANTITPELHTFDRWGNRIDEVEFHPAWHELMRTAVEHGLAGPHGSGGPGEPGPPLVGAHHVVGDPLLARPGRAQRGAHAATAP